MSNPWTVIRVSISGFRQQEIDTDLRRKSVDNSTLLNSLCQGGGSCTEIIDNIVHDMYDREANSHKEAS